MVDFSRDDWRLLPRDVLDTENNQDAAQAWGDAQRKQIAQKWADAINRGIRTPGFADPNAIQSSGYNQPRAGGFVGAGAVLSSPYAQSSSQPAPPPGSAAPDTAPPALTPQDQPDSGAPPVGAPQSDSLPAPSDQSSSSAPPVTTAALSGGVPKTVSQEGGAFYGLGDREMGIARQAGDEARRRGFGDEGAKALQAILLTEGGLTGARGDQGQSAGPLQFYKGGGQLNNFAKQNGMSESAAMDYVEQNPVEAIKWALGDQDKPGYLGAALKYGISKGLTGADLATYAQKYGQVSVSPERAGQWHNTVFGSGQDPFSRPITKGQAEGIGGLQSDSSATQGPVGLGNAGLGWASQGEAGGSATGAGVANQKEDRGYRNQFQLGLSDGDAYAACGPAAAIAFAKANGRNPTTDEAMQLAKSVGWSQNQGMAGVASEQGLLNKMNVSTTLERDVDWNHVAKDATNGNPVIVSTPGHYFYVDDVRQGYGGNNQFHVGGSGTALKGGSEWMTADEIQQRMGKTTGALYADHPLAEGPSTTETSPTAVDKWQEIPSSGRIFPTPVTAQPGSQSGFNADTSGINSTLSGQPPVPSAPPGVGDMQMPFATTPPKSVHEALDQASKIAQNTPRPLAGPGGLGAYDPRLSPFNKGETGGAGEIADLSLGGKVAEVGETLGPERIALLDEAVQIINKLDAGTEDSGPLLDRLQEIDKAFSGPSAAQPGGVRATSVITATQPASEANTVRELSVWLANKQGPPGISVEPQGVLGKARPEWGKSIVFRDESGVPQGILSITNDAAGKPDVAEVAVNPEFQRQGIATKLYQAAKNAGIDVDAVTGRGGYTPEGAAFAQSRIARGSGEAVSAAPGYGPTELASGMPSAQALKGAAQPFIKTAATAFEPAANIPEAQKPAFERFAATIGPASRASKFEGEQLQRRVDKVMGDMTPQETIDAIKSFERTGEFSADPTPEQSQLAADLRQDFQQSLQHGADHGYGGPDVTKQPGGPNFFFPHKYVDENPPGISTGETRSLAPGGELTKERQFKTIDEAVAAGKVPDSLSEAIKGYVINSRDNVAKTQLIDELSQIPGSMVKLNKYGQVPEGMVPGSSIDQRVGSPLKDYAVNPALADSIKNVLTPSGLQANTAGRALMTAVATAKQSVFSMSSFHAMTEAATSYYSGRDVGNNFIRAFVSPDFMEFQRSGPMADTFIRASKAGLVGLTDKASPDAMQALLGNIPQGIVGGIGGAGTGYTQSKLAGDTDEEAGTNALKFGAAGAALGGLPVSMSGKSLPRILTEATFERAVPMAKVTFWDSLVKGGLDEVTAAKVANQRFGGLNYDMMGRNKTFQDVMRLAVMAPDWNESTLRTVADAVLGHGKSAGASRDFLARTIIGSAVATEATQYAFTGRLTVDSPLGPGNESGHQGELEYQLGSGRMVHVGLGPGNVVAYGNLINKLVSDPEKYGDTLKGFVKGRLSTPVTAGMDVLESDRRTSQGGLAGMAQRVAPIGVEQVAQGSQSGVSPAVTMALAALGVNPRYSAPQSQRVVIPAAPKAPGAPKIPRA